MIPAALLDTTTQIDRIKCGERREILDQLLSAYDLHAGHIGLLEFKAVVIQECITIYNRLKLRKRFTFARDELLESNHRQKGLRAHIFNNHVQIFGSSLKIDEAEDIRLGRKAQLNLENVIECLYDWFQNSVEKVIDVISCTRALEPPKKAQSGWSANLPNCHRGKNKFCHVEEFIRAKAGPLLHNLKQVAELDESVQKAIHVLEGVVATPGKELSVRDCQSAGDCLVALEGIDFVTHAVGTNARDWKPIATAIGYEFVHINYRQ